MKVWQVHTPFFFDELSSSQRKDLNLHPYQEVGDIIRESETVGNLIYINNIYVIVEGKTFRNFCTLIGTETESSVGTPATTIDDLPDATATSRGVVGIEEQTFGGVKHFSSFPETPSSSPSTNYQVANKKYVDDLTTAASYGIQGAVDTYAELPSPTTLQPRTIYIVRQNTVGYENGLYWVVDQSGSKVWEFLDKLDLQDAAEVPYDPTIVGLLTATDTQGAIDEVAGTIYDLPQVWAKDVVLKVDPVNGNDANANGSEFKPFKTITAAMASISTLPSTPEGCYQWSAEKIIFDLAPGMYAEGGTEDVPNNVELNLKRCRLGIMGHGVRIMGGITWTFDVNDLPYGNDFFMNTMRPYFASPWKDGANHVSPTLDIIGEGAGMEGAFTADSIIVMGAVTQFAKLVTTTGWQSRTGNSYCMVNQANLRGGILQTGETPIVSTLSAFVCEINDSAIAGGVIGGMYLGVGIKAHNSQLASVIGPQATIYEIDNCRIQGGFDRTANGAASGNIQFQGSTAYSGIRDCAINATLFKIGNGTSAVNMYCDEITAKQILANTIDTGTGAFVMNVIDVHSGTTAQRPTYTKVNLGYRYFDTTLQKPIWRGTSGWVDATGTLV